MCFGIGKMCLEKQYNQNINLYNNKEALYIYIIQHRIYKFKWYVLQQYL